MIELMARKIFCDFCTTYYAKHLVDAQYQWGMGSKPLTYTGIP